MRKTITVAAKDLPPVLNVLLHKPNVDITLTDSVTINRCDMEWSGGSRTVYSLVELGTGKVTTLSSNTLAWGADTFSVRLDLQPGFVLVETGVFCGKPSAGHVYANAADVTAALPKPALELPHYLQQTLKAIASYNSKGKERHRADLNLGRQAWDGYVAELILRGLCNKNGSLTPEGKNVARTIDSLILNPYSDKFKG